MNVTENKASVIKLKEAFARSEMNGKKVRRKDLAAALFPGVSETAQQVNLTNLINGRTKRIASEWVKIICDMLDCTPNYLFGFEN